MTEPVTLIVALDPETRRFLLAALLAGRRELGRNGIGAPESFDRLVAAIAAPSGPERPVRDEQRRAPDAALMSYAEAAGRLRVSPRTVRRLVASGELPAVYLGRRALIRPGDVEALAGARRG